MISMQAPLYGEKELSTEDTKKRERRTLIIRPSTIFVRFRVFRGQTSNSGVENRQRKTRNDGRPA
jgi:hypothetical protein